MLDLDAIELDCAGTGVTRLYEVPGQTLHLAVTGFGTHHVVVFGADPDNAETSPANCSERNKPAMASREALAAARRPRRR